MTISKIAKNQRKLKKNRRKAIEKKNIFLLELRTENLITYSDAFFVYSKILSQKYELFLEYFMRCIFENSVFQHFQSKSKHFPNNIHYI